LHPAETTIVLTNLGLDPDASGDARLRIEDDCERECDGKAEDFAGGQLRVGRGRRGAINVALALGEPVAHIEFDTRPDQPDELLLSELLLTFDLRGQLAEARRGRHGFLGVLMPG
jgi:hypothetical protein